MRSVATGSSSRRCGRWRGGIAGILRSALRVIQSVVSCARMCRPSSVSTSSGPPVRGKAASSRSAPAVTVPRRTLLRADGESARCARCSTRRRSAALACPPVRDWMTITGGSAQGESTGSVTRARRARREHVAPRAGGIGAAVRALGRAARPRPAGRLGRGGAAAAGAERDSADEHAWRRARRAVRCGSSPSTTGYRRPGCLQAPSSG